MYMELLHLSPVSLGNDPLLLDSERPYQYVQIFRRDGVAICSLSPILQLLGVLVVL